MDRLQGIVHFDTVSFGLHLLNMVEGLVRKARCCEVCAYSFPNSVVDSPNTSIWRTRSGAPLPEAVADLGERFVRKMFAEVILPLESSAGFCSGALGANSRHVTAHSASVFLKLLHGPPVIWKVCLSGYRL